MDVQLVLLLRLLAAHVLSDFVSDSLLRSRADGESGGRWRSARPYVHGLIATGLTYLLAGRWNALWLIPVVFVVHVVSDLAGPGRKRRDVSFSDQALHLVVLLVVWLMLLGPVRGGAVANIVALVRSQDFWTVVVAYAIVFWPCNVLVAGLMENWSKQDSLSSDGLESAGKWIGRLERILVVTFVLLNRFEAVGFLIAAKSVLRIGSVTGHNDRKRAEYILVGTMLSLTLAIAVGLVAARLLT